MPRKPKRRKWGAGSIFERGGRWYCRWRENGKHRARSFPDRATAEAVLAEVIVAVARGGAGLPRDRRDIPSLDELAQLWLARREKTHRSAKDDRCRWGVHLKPAFGHLKPQEVDAAKIRAFVEKELGRLKPATICRCVGMLSTFFEDLREQGHVTVNPVSTLPKSTRHLFRSDHDRDAVLFLETPADLRRVFLALPSPVNVAFAVGALGGLRTGEVLALTWENVDLEARRIHVRQQVRRGQLSRPKDDDSRTLPILNALLPILTEYKLATGGRGLLFQPAEDGGGGRPELGSPPTFVRPQTFIRHLHKALAACGLPKMTWYSATRHTFASQWVLGGNSIESLSKILGHASVTTTEHYAHLRPGLFAEKAYDAIHVSLARPAGDVVSLPASSVPLVRSLATKQDVMEDENLAQVSVS
jgi:integrase